LAKQASTNTTIADKLKQMQDRLAELNKNNFNPDRGEPDQQACVQAAASGGFYGPFIDV